MGMVLCLLCACSTVPAYHHYEHVAEEGWDKRDTMVFSVDTIVRIAQEELGLYLPDTVLFDTK